ncbi:hypothetical protein VAR608DRAFT_1326 [Variovorax sp. HW608]|nr:hypothetical protein VAR608DRAFT_1326 [Variovorax sp. HW608]
MNAQFCIELGFVEDETCFDLLQPGESEFGKFNQVLLMFWRISRHINRGRLGETHAKQVASWWRGCHSVLP